LFLVTKVVPSQVGQCWLLIVLEVVVEETAKVSRLLIASSRMTVVDAKSPPKCRRLV
jgi:hypothetical protein